MASVTPTEMDTTKQALDATMPETPATLLSVPREIRQKILNQSYHRFIFLEWFTPDPNERCPYYWSNYQKVIHEDNLHKCRSEKRKVQAWAKEMRTVYSIIRDDMVYVYKQVADFDRLIKQSQGGRNIVVVAVVKWPCLVQVGRLGTGTGDMGNENVFGWRTGVIESITSNNRMLALRHFQLMTLNAEHQ